MEAGQILARFLLLNLGYIIYLIVVNWSADSKEKVRKYENRKNL
jgi:hypothetical protein